MSKKHCLDPRRWLDTAARFVRCPGGNYAILFALSLVPLIGVVGAAIDYSRAAQMRGRLQAATDAASLSVNKMIGVLNDDEIEDYARDMLNANLTGLEGISLDSLEVIEEDNMVTIGASTSLKTTTLGVLGIDEIDVSVEAQAVAGTGRFEIVLVLDNSRSMLGERMRDIQDAASDLIETMFDEAGGTGSVRIGIVPFSAGVNVGTHLHDADWIDGDGLSPIHSENFDTPTSRFDLYDAMNGVSWAGCVEARPYPLDVTDTATSPHTPETYFVPWFAPDEPDHDSAYSNRYLDDGDGSCSVDVATLTDPERQALTCKYTDEAPDAAYGRGPNYQCTSVPITPLSTSKQTLLSAIDGMVADSTTNIHQGVMWGWRVLSPGVPFTNGRAYDDDDNQKIIVLMTDGRNNLNGQNTHNMSNYSAYGYSALGRLRSPTSITEELQWAMDARTTETCDNAKTAGITIYTIALEIADDETQEMLGGCASSDLHAFDVDGTSEMLAAFRQITNEIALLRLSR